MAKVVTDDSHYKAIANTIRNLSHETDDSWPSLVMFPSEMPSYMTRVAKNTYNKGYADGELIGYSDGFQDGYDDGFTSGERSGLAICASKHFVQNFVGDGGTSCSFHVPFEPDAVQIFGFDPLVGNKSGALASFFYDCRAFGLIGGTIQYGTGRGSLSNGMFSTTSVLNRYSRAEDGTITIKDIATGVTYGTGLPYTMVAVKYTEQTDKERITAFVNGLDGSGSVTLNQAKVNAAFTDDEWAALIATKPDWTFAWI